MADAIKYKIEKFRNERGIPPTDPIQIMELFGYVRHDQLKVGPFPIENRILIDGGLTEMARTSPLLVDKDGLSRLHFVGDKNRWISPELQAACQKWYEDYYVPVVKAKAEAAKIKAAEKVSSPPPESPPKIEGVAPPKLSAPIIEYLKIDAPTAVKEIEGWLDDIENTGKESRVKRIHPDLLKSKEVVDIMKAQVLSGLENEATFFVKSILETTGMTEIIFAIPEVRMRAEELKRIKESEKDSDAIEALNSLLNLRH